MGKSKYPVIILDFLNKIAYDNRMKNDEKIQGFGQQVILYAKGWYGRSDKGSIHDLKLLLAKYSSLDLHYVSNRDAWEILCRTFGDCVTGFDVGEALFETVGGKWDNFTPCQRKTEDVLLGKISQVDGKYVDMTKKMDYRLDSLAVMTYNVSYNNEANNER